ncbi:type II/IV secretion system protein [Candidatus Gracilibacteria bacterium]|nr:type II/IV secretion system protein [Candidatus Gracilibacteria bacterium]
MDFDLQKIIKKSTKHSKNKSSTAVDDLFGIESKSDGGTNSDLNLRYYGNKIEDSYIIGLVNDIFLNALGKRASDIHIEPTDEEVIVRFRIDGVFVKYKSFKLSEKDSIIARIKIMSYLRIDEHRLPQDGKISYRLFAGKAIDMRVSVIPTIYGEKCVIRILRKDTEAPKLKDLGIMPYNMVRIDKHLKNNYGMILAVGPTGSGKSTTLFGLLSHFDPSQKNISTLEDPVEYRIKGVNHTQINPAIDFTFARGLRSLLRQDPDIIMVGEIRDEETAKLAVEASITGHIVFSTIHTNSAAHTIQRIVNLGVDPLLVTSSLRMIISQRLARKLCPYCKEKYEASEKIKNFFVKNIGKYMKNKDSLTLYKAKEGGCEKCNHIGYKGRVGFFEVLEMTEGLEKLILNNSSRLQLEIQAIGDGMVTIKQDGLVKVLLGETSIEELLSVLGT